MSVLNYKPGDRKEHVSQSKIYHVHSMYDQPELKKTFLELRANIVDLNPALITKCIQGTEQDFIMLMNKAKDFIHMALTRGDRGCEAMEVILLDLFQECVFGYYILTPLIRSKEISDIKVLAWNQITCKANGERYVTDLSFVSEDDYNKWYERILRIHHLYRNEQNALQHCTDIKGVSDFFLRIDIELSYITSMGVNNIHIRKIPTQKYSWEYLMEAGMLDENMKEYLRDRVINNYSFLISGKGGSGKTALLNNLIDWIPYNQSGLFVQESDELYSGHPQFQFEHVLSRTQGDNSFEYNLEDLLRLGLLQDIDNFGIGEIKGGEALYVFTTAISTGARFFGTIHSNSAAGSVRRLAQLARYVSDYSVDTLEEMLSTIPFCLIFMSHFGIREIVEIVGWDTQYQCLQYHKVFMRK